MTCAQDGRDERPRGVIITNLYATPDDPSRGTFNQQQFRALQKLHDLTVIVPIPHRYPRAARPHTIDPGGEQGAPRSVYLNVWHPPIIGRVVNAAIIEATIMTALRNELAVWKPEYVLGSFAYPEGVAAVNIARRLGVPAFVKVHGSDINVMAGRAAIRWQLRRTLPRANGVIAVSRSLHSKVVCLGARSPDTLLLYNGIDRQRFRPLERGALREVLGLPTGRKSILYVGNLKRDKGVADLLTAFALLVREDAVVDLEYVGTGGIRDELLSSIESAGLVDRVRLHGARPHEQIVDWLGACDVVCLPSYAEGVPNILLEAQACGRPIVATNVGGIPEVVGPGAGILVECANPAALARGLARALATEWDAQSIVEGLVVRDWTQNATRLSEFIRDRSGSMRRHPLSRGAP